MRSSRFVIGTAAAALTAGSGVYASPVSFTASAGNLAASARFETSGNNLIVTLTNTSTFDVLVPADVLTAVFFNSSGGALSLGRTSAVLGPGSVVHFGGSDPGGVVGGEWAYGAGLSGTPGGTGYGISSAGFGLFGPGDLFPGSNLQGPLSPDGLQYGIIPLADNISTGNSAVTGSNALIQDRVVFTLSGLPAGYDPSVSIRDVWFQYGTALDEPSIPGVPAPGGLVLLAGAGAAALRRRR